MDIATKVAELDVRVKANTERIENIERDRNSLEKSVQKMTTAIEILANEQKHFIEEQRNTNIQISKLHTEVENLKLEPAERAKMIMSTIIRTALSTLCGAIVGAIIALIVK